MSLESRRRFLRAPVTPSVGDERNRLELRLAAAEPTIGAYLGAQLMSRAPGGRDCVGATKENGRAKNR
ncbi:MAG: hypothetical protein J2P48_24030, partial [Alphaproteobacteria bacterium]|nr:hypothetical protein [Alphaproteobacteria bacterium]